MYPMRTRLLITTIFILSLSVVVIEYLKHRLFPNLTLIQSHMITLGLMILVLSVITFLIHSIVRKLNTQLIKKQGEKSRLESALFDSDKRFRAVFENSVNSIILVDAETLKNVDFNTRTCELLGYTRDEFEKLTIMDYELLPAEELKKRYEKLMNEGPIDSFETKFRKKSGQSIDVTLTTRLLNVETRKYFLLIWEEFGERRRLQAKALEQLDFLNTLIETIPAPVFYKDREGKYLGCNRAFEEFLGVSKGELIGKTVYDIAPLDIAEKYSSKDEELFKKEGFQTYEWQVRTKKLGLRDVVFNKAPFRDYKGNEAGLIGVILDITDRKRSETELKRSRDAIAEHNRILLEWTSPEILYKPDFEMIMKRITESVSKMFKVERVGIWLFNTDFTKLYSMDLFDLKENSHSHDSELVVADYPSYFAALRKERVIVCSNALSDPRYKEFLETYIKPFKISSLLDVPVMVSGESIGVMCIEHRGEPRNWTLEEQNFAISIANLFSLALEISRHKQLEQSYRATKDNFINIIEKLSDAVLIVDMKGTVKFVNAASEKFFGGRIKEMLGSEFPYPLVPDGKSSAELRIHDGHTGKVSFLSVRTRWDNEPALLVSVRGNKD